MEKIEIVGRFDEDDSPPPSSASSETSSKHGSRGATFEDGDLLHAAAFYSRVPAEEMTQQEEHAFPDVGHGSPELQKVFLLIRNRFLQLWLFSPKNELTLENAIANLESPYSSEKVLAARIHAYLARYGFINFGIYSKTTPKPKPDVRRPRVVVIGAGISGLTAASQLQQFGFEVVVLEGRDRIGGRIATFRKHNYIADLGASFVPGIGGNPLAVVVRQLDTQLVKMARKCPLYEAATGIPVAKDRDDAIEKEFKRLLEASAFLAHSLDIDRIDRNAPLSLGQAMEWLITLQEKRVKEQEVAYWKEYTSIQQRLMEIRDLLWEARKVAEQMKARVERTCSAISRQQKKAKKTVVGNESFDSPRVEDVPLMMDAKIDIQVREERLRAWKRLDDEREQLELKLKKLIKNRPSEMYLSTADRQVLDWHLARLEYGNACRLEELSLKYWDHDEPYAFPGPHSAVVNGFSTVPVALAEGLDIRLKQIVKKMSYSRDGVEVTTMKGETFTGDAILCTLPLGVLKEAVRPEAQKEEKDVNVSGWKPEFSPPLPSWKEGAINRLGYGVINKVVLCFQRCFWDTAVNMFGHVASTTESRGELFLFFYVYKAPVLVGLVVGEAAGVMESVTDEIVIGRCLSVLRNIFGVAQVPNPTETVVTRWKSDPMARGSYSYIGVGSSGADYDVLAAPVSPSADAGTGPKFPRLFFAGEHTMRRYPSTVHGALLSGLREAGKIADIYLGSPYVQPK